jgi:hypothetical protein
MTNKAQIGGFIKTKGVPRSARVIATDGETGYVLETGEVIADAEIGFGDVLLESKVT